MSMYGRRNPQRINDNDERITRIAAILARFFHGGKFALFPGMFAGRASVGGAGTIASTTTSVTVNHGTGRTPAAEQIHLTMTNNPTNTPGHVWVSAIDDTSFDVNCESDPGASGMAFRWEVSPI